MLQLQHGLHYVKTMMLISIARVLSSHKYQPYLNCNFLRMLPMSILLTTEARVLNSIVYSYRVSILTTPHCICMRVL